MWPAHDNGSLGDLPAETPARQGARRSGLRSGAGRLGEVPPHGGGFLSGGADGIGVDRDGNIYCAARVSARAFTSTLRRKGARLHPDAEIPRM